MPAGGAGQLKAFAAGHSAMGRDGLATSTHTLCWAKWTGKAAEKEEGAFRRLSAASLHIFPLPGGGQAPSFY